MKRLRYTRFVALLAVVAVLTTSCESGFEELNTDPKAANEIDPNFLFTNILVSTPGTGYAQWRVNLIYPTAMMQIMTNTWWAGDKYLYPGNEDWMTSMWDVLYGGAGSSRATVRMLQDLIATRSDDPTMVNKVAVARIWRAFVFHRLTDIYGDIPYFEAGKGYLEDNVQPAFTPQSEIYPDMIKELEEAVASFDPSQPTYGAADLLYEGDLTKWRKFANSLKLRLAMRLAKVDPTTAQREAQEAIAAGVMESNDDSAVLMHANVTSAGGTFDGTDDNPISSVLFRSDNPMWAERWITWMQEHDDPRLQVIAGQYDKGAHTADAVLVTDDPDELVGFPSGNDPTTIQQHPTWDAALGMSRYAQPKKVLRNLDDPTFFLTYAHTALLRAEAAARNWTSENAAEQYANGVRAAMEMLSAYDKDGATTISAEEIDAYLAANPYDAANALEQINTQYWAANFFDGIEAWANWRRTGYPALVQINYPGNPTGGTIPRRMRYPTEEQVLNAANYDAVIARQGPDEFTTRVWWDVQ